MSKRFLSGINVTGTATLNTVADAGSNTDKFLVLDASNNVSYRTAAELYADLGIGALPAAYTSTLKHEVKASQTIGKGQAVYVSSADGTNMIVSKASNVSEQFSSKTMGLLETSLVTNGKGNVITEGLLSGLNTNGANAGDPVWLGVDGALIYGLANKPYAPAHLVFIGIVTRANSNNGEIFVKVQNGFEMNELHNYLEGSVQNNQVIVYESATSLYKPKTIPTILGYTPVPDYRTITINGTSYDLSADRSWTISANQNARTEYEFTTNGSTATYSAVYSIGQVDVFYNGSKLSSTEFTATNGTSVTLGFTPPSGQLVEIVAWETGGGVANGRTLTINGVAFDLSANRSWTIDNASLGAQAQLNGTGLVRMSGTTVSYDNATYATQSYVTTAVSNLVNSAPSTLDTLNELAAALGNDANFATTVTNSIATKLPLSGGTLTGATTMQINSNSVVDFLNLYNTSQTSAGGRITFGNGYGYIGAIKVSQRDNGSLADDGQIEFQVASNAVLDTKMTILNTGNIGIGTNNPFSFGSGHRTLEVRGEGTSHIGALFVGNSDKSATLGFYINPAATGTIGTSSNLALQLVTNDIERLRVTTGGAIGIGISTPTASKLSLGMGVGAKFMVYDNPGAGVYSGLGQDLAAGNSIDLFAHGYSNLGFITFGKLGTNASTYTEWARFNTSGNFGIGTTSPLQALGRTLTVEGTGIFQTGVGGGNYNENLRLNRTGNGYSAIAMGGTYGSTSGSGVGVWTIAATPAGTNYRLDLDYNGGTRLSFRTDGQIQQGGVGIVQIVPIGPTSTNISYTATINGQYAIGSSSIPSDARWVLADIFITANISDHENFMLTRQNLGAQKSWVDTRGNNPDSEFGNLTQTDIAILTYNGEADGFTPNYGVWKSSVLVPTVGRNVWINNYGNSNSNGYIYFIVRGYSL